MTLPLTIERNQSMHYQALNISFILVHAFLINLGQPPGSAFVHCTKTYCLEETGCWLCGHLCIGNVSLHTILLARNKCVKFQNR